MVEILSNLQERKAEMRKKCIVIDSDGYPTGAVCGIKLARQILKFENENRSKWKFKIYRVIEVKR
jgi:hypothetical protein